MKQTIREQFAAEVRPLFPLVVARDYEAGKVADALLRVVLRGLPKAMKPDAKDCADMKLAVHWYNRGIAECKKAIRRKQ